MKKVNITKRLLLVVTAFALIVCALTAVVGAQTDYEELFKVLEYFEEPIVADEDFEGEFNPADNVIGLVNGQTAEVVTDGDNSYLKLTLAADAADAATLMAKWNSAAGSASSVIMSLDFMLSADGGQTYDCLICGVVGAPVSDLMDIGYLACPSCYMGETDGFLFINDAKLPNFSVYVNEDEDGCDHTDAHDAGKLLFELNPYNNIYTYANGNSTSNVTFSYSAGTWLTLEVVMLDGEYTLNIKDAAGTVLATQTDVDFPVDEIASVKMGSLNGIPGQQNINGVVSVDNVYVQGGTYLRNDADKQTVTESALVDLAAAYKTETDETTRDELLSVFNRIITLHGFTTTNAEVNAAVAELVEYFNAALPLFGDLLIIDLIFEHGNKLLVKKRQIKRAAFYLNYFYIIFNERLIDCIFKIRATQRSIKSCYIVNDYVVYCIEQGKNFAEPAAKKFS